MTVPRGLLGLFVVAAAAALAWLWWQRETPEFAPPRPASKPRPRDVASRPLPLKQPVQATPSSQQQTPAHGPVAASSPAALTSALELTLLGPWDNLVVRLARTEPPIEFNRNYPVKLRAGQGIVVIPLPSPEVSGAYLGVLAEGQYPIWEGMLRIPPRKQRLRLPPRELFLVAVRGLVANEKGVPIEGAEAYARRFLGGNEYWRRSAVTSTEGTFELGNLLPGHYEVRVASKRHYQVWEKDLDLRQNENLDIVFKTSYLQEIVVEGLDRFREFPGPYRLEVALGVSRVGAKRMRVDTTIEYLRLNAEGRTTRALERGMHVRVERLVNGREELEQWSGRAFIVGEQNPYVVKVGGNTARVRFIVRSHRSSPWIAIELIRPGLFTGIQANVQLLEWPITKLIPLGRFVLVASTPGHRAIIRTLEVREGMEPVLVEFTPDSTVRDEDLPRHDHNKLREILRAHLEWLKEK